MPADWKTIQADPEYQALPTTEQAKVTAAYLSNLMASKPDVGPTRARAAQLPADDTVSASESWADDPTTPPHPNDLASRQIPANLKPQTTPGQMLNQAVHGVARGAVTMGPYGMLDTMLQGAPLADRIKAQAAPPVHTPVPRYPMDTKNPAQQRLDQVNQALDLARGLTYGPFVDAYHATQDLADSNAITLQHPMGFEGSIDGAPEALRQTLPRAIGETAGMMAGDPMLGIAHFKGAPAPRVARDLAPHWSGIDPTDYASPAYPRPEPPRPATPAIATPPAPAPDPAGGSTLAHAPVPIAPQRLLPAPHEMTRAAFEATGDDLMHGTSRPVEQFDPAALDRHNKADRNPEGRFYFTDQPEIAHSMANATGYKQVDLHRFADSADLEPHEAVPELLASLKKQVDGGKTLWATDPETAHVVPMTPDDPRVAEALHAEDDVRLYPENRAPNVIQTKVYGPTLDLTDPKNIPADLRARLEAEGRGYNPWDDKLPNFNHEYSPELIRYARENGYGKIKVKDTYESGYRSTIGLHEYIGHGRDPHRAFVEKALAEGEHVPPHVLADYPDLAPKPAKARPQPAEVKPGTLKGLVAGEEGAFDPMAFFRKKKPAAEPVLPPQLQGQKKAVHRETVDAAHIHLDPQSYQFKASDSQGRTNRLAGVEAWDAEGAGMANPVILHQRLDGTYYVADGHQRVNLAKRLQAEGKPVPPLNALVLRESDGWTVPEVRNKASRLNIQQGTGTALDVARLIKDGGMSERDMAIMPKQGDQAAAFRAGRRLAKLGDKAFLFVANEHVVPGDARRNAALGAEVADATSDPAHQLAILEEMAKDPPQSEREAALMAREMVAEGFSTHQQASLFGMDAFAKGHHRTVAKILKGIEASIKNDKSIGALLTKRADDITAIEGNTLNEAANKAMHSEAEQLQYALDKLATVKGPFRDALKRIAQEVDSERLDRPTLSQAVAAARKELAAALAEELHTPEPGPERPGPVHRQPGEVHGPSLFGPEFTPGPAKPAAEPVKPAKPAAAPDTTGRDLHQQLEVAYQQYNKHLADGNKDAARLALDHINALQEAGADISQAKPFTPPTPKDLASRQSLQARINAVEKKRAAFEAAGDKENAGIATARLRELREKLDPEHEPTARLHPDEVRASDYHNFRVADYEHEESEIRAKVIREVVSQMPYDPHARIRMADDLKAAMALPWKDVDAALREGLKRGETLPRILSMRFTVESKILGQEIARAMDRERDILAGRHGGDMHAELKKVQDEIEGMNEQLKRYTNLTLPDRSEKGRALRALAFRAADDFDPAHWIGAYRKAAGKGLGDTPKQGSKADKAETRINKQVAKGASAKARLNADLDWLEARNIDHGISRTPQPHPMAGKRTGGAIARFFDALRSLARQESGSFNPGALMDWLFGPKHEGPPPVDHADPEVKARLESAAQAAHDVVDAAAEIAKEVEAAKLDSPMKTVLTFTKAGMIAGLNTFQKVVLSHEQQIILEGIAKWPASAAAALLMPITKGHELTIIPPDAARILMASYHAVTQGGRDFVHTMAHGVPEGDVDSAHQHPEPNSSLPLAGLGMDLFSKLTFRSHTATYRPFYLYGAKREMQDFALVQAIRDKRIDRGLNVLERAHEIMADPVKTLGEERAAIMLGESHAAGLYTTFSEPNAVANALSSGIKKLRGESPGLAVAAEVQVPFYHIPANVVGHLLEYAMVGGVWNIGDVAGRRVMAGWNERSLGRVVEGLSRDEQRTIALAIGRGMTGAGVMYLGALIGQKAVNNPVMQKVLETLGVGDVTAIGEEKRARLDRATGKKPGGIEINGEYVSDDAGGIIAGLMSMGATLGKDPAVWQEMGFTQKAAALLGAGIHTIAEAPMVSGMKTLQKLVEHPMEAGPKFLGSLAGRAIPAPLADLARAQDPYERRTDKHAGFTEGVTNRIPAIPGVSDNGRMKQQPLIDIHGNPVPNPKQGWRAIGLWAGTPDRTKNDPLLATMDRLGINPPVSKGEFAMPHRGKADAVKVKLTPELDTAYQQAVGQMRDKIAGRVVTSPGFQKLLEEGKDDTARDKLKEAFRKAIKAGKADFLAQHKPALLALKIDALRARQEARAKSSGVGTPETYGTKELQEARAKGDAQPF